MDRFFYDILNIGKQKFEEEDYFKILKNIIEEETDLSKKYNPNLDRLCKVISNNINSSLKEKNINSKIINTKELYDDMYEHQFLISSYINLNDDINYILIDPTYSQFKHKNDYDMKMLYPEDILNKTEEGKKILSNLLNYGYTKIDDNDLKRYIGSIMYEEDINKIDITINDILLERRKQ